MVSDQNVKSDLKNVLREHLDKRVSNLLLEQSFAIIDQAAISKESLTAAADRISRKVALFVDNSLSQTVYSNLMALIGTTSSPQGIKRRYARADFPHKVLVKYNGKEYELNAENISEGGMLIKAAEQFPIDAKVEITLSLEPGHRITVKGIVATNNNPVRSASKGLTGMGIEFNKDVDMATATLVRKYVEAHYHE